MKLHRKLNRSRYVALACSAVAIAFAGTSSADAPDESHYTMSVIADAAYGYKALAENYDEVIARLENSEHAGIRRFFAANNLCVAYVKTGDLDNAKDSCDLAVSTIRTAIDTDRELKRDTFKAQQYRTFLAVALSNRGVAHAITGSPELARNDFTDALKVDTKIREPEINLARLSKEDAPSA